MKRSIPETASRTLSAPRVHSASPPGSHPPRQIWRCVSSRGLAIAACLPGLGSRGFALGRVFLGHLGLGQKTKPRDGWCCSALGAALDTGSFSETPRLRDGADCVCPIQLYRARPASSSVDSIPFWDSSHLIRLTGRMSVFVSFKSSFGRSHCPLLAATAAGSIQFLRSHLWKAVKTQRRTKRRQVTYE